MPRRSSKLQKDLRAIGKAFKVLARHFARIAPQMGEQSDVVISPSGKRRKPRLTAAHRAGLKLQGKYMGTMRGLSAAKRAKVKKIRASKGIRAAIAAARRTMLGLASHDRLGGSPKLFLARADVR